MLSKDYQYDDEPTICIIEGIGFVEIKINN